MWWLIRRRAACPADDSSLCRARSLACARLHAAFLPSCLPWNRPQIHQSWIQNLRATCEVSSGQIWRGRRVLFRFHANALVALLCTKRGATLPLAVLISDPASKRTLSIKEGKENRQRGRRDKKRKKNTQHGRQDALRVALAAHTSQLFPCATHIWCPHHCRPGQKPRGGKRMNDQFFLTTQQSVLHSMGPSSSLPLVIVRELPPCPHGASSCEKSATSGMRA